MQSFFSLILVVLGGWAAAGAVTTFIGKSDNITEGMKKVGRAVVDWWSSSTPPPQSLILEWQISGLTQSIEIFFDFIFFIEGIENNDFMRITYRFNNCKVDINVINAAFQKYLQTNSYAAYYGNIVTDVFIDGETLTLLFARSCDAITQLYTLRFNRLTHQTNTNNDDIVE